MLPVENAQGRQQFPVVPIIELFAGRRLITWSSVQFLPAGPFQLAQLIALRFHLFRAVESLPSLLVATLLAIELRQFVLRSGLVRIQFDRFLEPLEPEQQQDRADEQA